MPDSHDHTRVYEIAEVHKLGENISVKRFARFKVGDVGETIAISKAGEAAAE